MPKELNVNIQLKGIWNPVEAGDFVTGFYMDKIEFQDSKYDNAMFLIGSSEKGAIGVNEYSVIRRSMDRVPKGAFVQIVFEGEKKGSKYTYKAFTLKAWDLTEGETVEWESKVKAPKSIKSDNGKNEDPDPAKNGADNDNDLPF